MYHEVVCAECEASGDSAEFFMWCGGNPDQAMFDTGNCCIVSYEQLDGQQDTRRLGKCTVRKDEEEGFELNPKAKGKMKFRIQCSM